jgi:hypothetical protein
VEAGYTVGSPSVTSVSRNLSRVMSEFGSTGGAVQAGSQRQDVLPAVSGMVTSALPRYCHFWYEVSARSAVYCTMAGSAPSTNSACRPGVPACRR